MPDFDKRERVHRRWMLALLFFLIATALWIALFTTARFTQRDAYDYAQLARQIHTHQGYTTLQLFPRDLPYFKQQGFLENASWPSLHRYPVVPLTGAFFQLFSADIVRAGVIQSGVFFLLTVPILFLFAERLAGWRIASLATVLYVGDPRMWNTAYNGMTESCAILIMLGIFWVALLPGTREGRRSHWLLLGFLCGLAYLARNQLLYVAPLGVLLACMVVPRRRLLYTLALFSTVVVLTASPWWIRNYIVTGEPLFNLTASRALLAKTPNHTRIDLVLNAPVEVGVVLDQYGDEIANKIWGNVWPNLVSPAFWFEALSGYALALPLFILGLLWRRRAPPVPITLFERATMVFILANFFLVSVTYHRPRYHEPPIPFLIVVLCLQLWWLCETLAPGTLAALSKRRKAAAFVALLAVVVVLHAFPTYVEHASLRLDPVELRSYRVLCELIDSESLVVSDLSLEVTVGCGNPTVRLPAAASEVLEIDDHYLSVDYLLVSRRAQRPHYRRFVESQEFLSRFELATRLPNEALLFRKVAFARKAKSPAEAGLSGIPPSGGGKSR